MFISRLFVRLWPGLLKLGVLLILILVVSGLVLVLLSLVGLATIRCVLTVHRWLLIEA